MIEDLTFSVKLQNGGQHLIQNGCWIWGSTESWGGGKVRITGIGSWPLPMLGFECESERDQACPVLWLQAFQAAVKILDSGTLSQAQAEWVFSHHYCNPTQPTSLTVQWDDRPSIPQLPPSYMDHRTQHSTLNTEAFCHSYFFLCSHFHT